MINWQAQRGSSSDDTDAVAAVTQRCGLLNSDSLRMPPGREAKINTICSVAGVQREHYSSAMLWECLNRLFNCTNRQIEIRVSMSPSPSWAKCIFLSARWKLLALQMILDTCFHVYFNKHPAFVAEPLAIACFQNVYSRMISPVERWEPFFL